MHIKIEPIKAKKAGRGGWGGSHLPEHMGSGSALSHDEPSLPSEGFKGRQLGEIGTSLDFGDPLAPGMRGGWGGRRSVWEGAE